MNLHDKIALMASRTTETGLESVDGASGCIIPAEFLQRLESRFLRKCAACGETFEAVGLQGYCEPCGIEVDQAAAAPPVRKLDSSWPRLHAGKLDVKGSTSGPHWIKQGSLASGKMACHLVLRNPCKF